MRTEHRARLKPLGEWDIMMAEHHVHVYHDAQISVVQNILLNLWMGESAARDTDTKNGHTLARSGRCFLQYTKSLCRDFNVLLLSLNKSPNTVFLSNKCDSNKHTIIAMLRIFVDKFRNWVDLLTALQR